MWDSTALSGATVKINTLGQTGDVLGPHRAADQSDHRDLRCGHQDADPDRDWNAGSVRAGVEGVTFTATQGAGLVRGLLINVTDDTNVQSIAAGVATINVNAAPLIPLVEHTGCSQLHHRANRRVQLLSSVTVTDGDSANMSGATVKINTLGQTGDVLLHRPAEQSDHRGVDAATKTLTCRGRRPKAQYEEVGAQAVS